MVPSKIENVFIEIIINLKGDVVKIKEGKFIHQKFIENSSIFTLCPFLEGTINAVPIKQSFLIEGMLIVVDNCEYNVDLELYKKEDFISVLIHNRTNVYKLVDQLNQNRNDLFFLKREITSKNKELEKLRIIAENANEAKSRFLAMMSHEVRNPLNVILNYTNLIQQESLSEKVKEFTKYLTISGNNLKVIVDDILDLSRVEAGKLVFVKEPVSLKNILKQIQNNYIASVKDKNIDLQFYCSKKIPELVLGDDVRIYQILTNLINNSIKFTLKGFVKTEILLDTLSNNKANILFKVSDSGRGMTKAQTAKIFEEYQQNQLNDNRIHKGAGLGLSIVKRLVTALKGNIVVESKLNIGTTFIVQIPFKIVKDNNQNNTKETKVKTKTFVKGKKILVADDNYLSLKIVEHILKKQQVNYTFVKDGVDALLAMEKERFDMVILDINMPNLTGEELVKKKMEFENNNSKIPFLALTGNNSKEDIKAYLSIGFDDVIAKPFTPTEFIEILEKHI